MKKKYKQWHQNQKIVRQKSKRLGKKSGSNNGNYLSVNAKNVIFISIGV